MPLPNDSSGEGVRVTIHPVMTPAPTDVMQTEALMHIEWRTCGWRADPFDIWEGPWRRERDPETSIASMKRRNGEVWLERREVTISPVERVDV